MSFKKDEESGSVCKYATEKRIACPAGIQRPRQLAREGTRGSGRCCHCVRSWPLHRAWSGRMGQDLCTAGSSLRRPRPQCPCPCPRPCHPCGMTYHLGAINTCRFSSLPSHHVFVGADTPASVLARQVDRSPGGACVQREPHLTTKMPCTPHAYRLPPLCRRDIYHA